MLSRSTSPRSHTSAIASPFSAGSPLPPSSLLPLSRDAGGAAPRAPSAAGAAGGRALPSTRAPLSGADKAWPGRPCNMPSIMYSPCHASAPRTDYQGITLLRVCQCRSGGEAEPRGGGGAAAAGADGARLEAAGGARGMLPSTAPLPPRHGHTLSGGSSGGSGLPPGLAGVPVADIGAGSGGSGALHGAAAAARRSSNALSDLGAEVQTSGSTSRRAMSVHGNFLCPAVSMREASRVQ